MNLTLIILCLVLFALGVSYKIIIEQKKLAERIRRRKVMRYISILDATEALIASTNLFPHTSTLLMCLYLKMLDTLRLLHDINSFDATIVEQINEVHIQLQKLQNDPTKFEFTHFQTPENDRQAIAMLKQVKSLKKVIKNALNKAYLTTQAFTIEDEKLSQIQLRINIDNVLTRVKNARQKGQLTIAQQLLKKSLNLLDTKSDDYSQQMKKHIVTILNEISESLTAKKE